MSANTPTPAEISEFAKQDEGLKEGSDSAQMQPVAAKETDAESQDAKVQQKLDDGAEPTEQDTCTIQSGHDGVDCAVAEADAAAEEAANQDGISQEQSDATKSEAAAESKDDTKVASTTSTSVQPTTSVDSSKDATTDAHAHAEGTVAAASNNLTEFQDAAKEVTEKIQHDPTTINSQDAARIESAETKLLGHRPPKDTISAEVKRMATANERGVDPVVAAEAGVKAASQVAPDTAAPIVHDEATKENIADFTQSKVSNGTGANGHNGVPSKREPISVEKERQFKEAVELIQPKIVHDPTNVNSEDAKLLQQTEQEAYGRIEKGGITARATSLAAANKA